MGRHNIAKHSKRKEQWSKEFVRVPEYPYIYLFNIPSHHIKCINTCSYYFATGISDVYANDHPLIDKLLAQI